MNESVRLGKIGGIRVGVHWSLLVILWLLIWSLAGGQLPHAAPGHAAAAYWSAAVAAALLFYGCLVFAGLGWAYLAAIVWSFARLFVPGDQPVGPRGQMVGD